MDFDLIYKLKIGKFWWLDVILYFVLALLVSLVVCFFLLMIKASSQEEYLADIKQAITETGTPQQKELENKVLEYQKKIGDFAVLLKSHKIPSYMFDFIEENTLPSVWFFEFKADIGESLLTLTGETESMQRLAQQMAAFKETGNITRIGLLSGKIAEEGKIKFTLGLSFNPILLNYIGE